MKTQLWVLPFAFLAVCVSDVMNKASTCGKSINHVQLSSWHNKNWQTVTHLQKGLPSDSSHTSVARSHVPSAISTSHGLLLPVTGENKSCHAMQYYTWPYCHQNITWPAVTRHWENKPCHVMPYYTYSYCHQNITWSAVACHWGKQVMPCHIMPCHTIHVLTAIRTSHGLLSPVTVGSKSCDNRLHRAIPYVSLPSARHTVCCRLSLGEASHAMSVPTIPYNTAISMPHGLLLILSGATKSHHTLTTSVITSHHITAYCTIYTILHYTTPYIMPHYIIYIIPHTHYIYISYLTCTILHIIQHHSIPHHAIQQSTIYRHRKTQWWYEPG